MVLADNSNYSTINVDNWSTAHPVFNEHVSGLYDRNIFVDRNDITGHYIFGLMHCPPLTCICKHFGPRTRVAYGLELRVELTNKDANSATVRRSAIVGSGPSGFYAAEALLKSNLTIHVHMYDRLATPSRPRRFAIRLPTGGVVEMRDGKAAGEADGRAAFSDHGARARFIDGAGTVPTPAAAAAPPTYMACANSRRSSGGGII